MSGQSAALTLNKARSLAKGAGCDYSPGETSGSKPAASNEGKVLGDSKGKSSSAGDHSGKGGKSKTKHMY